MLWCGDGNSVSLSLYSTVYERFGYFSVRLFPCGSSTLLIKKKKSPFLFLEKNAGQEAPTRALEGVAKHFPTMAASITPSRGVW